MDKLINLFVSSGIYQISAGQAVMIAVGLLLLFLAIKKNFEPLLLVPIGFGGIMANIPEAGLALSAVENALHLGGPEVIEQLANSLGLATADPKAVKEAYVAAGQAQHMQVTQMAIDAGYNNGMLYNF